jgi:hypothetical protein
MAKHKFTNSELAHAFFHQEEFGIDWGEGSSFSFRGNTLYSYSSIMGILIPEKNIFLFRSGSYSSSTSKHQAYTRGAIPHNIKTYYWPDWYISTNSRIYGGSHFAADIYTYKEYIEKEILAIKNDKYCLKTGTKYFGNPNKFLHNDIYQFCYNLDCLNLYEEYKEQLNSLEWTQEELDILAVKTWAYNNGINGSYETKLKVYNNPELAAEVIEKNRIAKEKLEATKEERRLKAVQKSIDKWYTGEINEINFQLPKRNGWAYRNSIPVYFRISPNDPQIVETSKGVKIPLVECALLYRKFQQCINTNTEWHQNGEKFRIGYYYVEKIYNNGTSYVLVAGCHTCYQEQIEEFVTKFVPEWKKQ